MAEHTRRQARTRDGAGGGAGDGDGGRPVAPGGPAGPSGKAAGPGSGKGTGGDAMPAGWARLLGFGLYLAWGSLIVPFEKGYGVAGFSSPIGRLCVFTAVSAALLVAVAWRTHRTGRAPWGSQSRALALFGACAVATPALELLSLALPAGGVVLDEAALVLRGVADAGIFLMWSAQLAGHRARVAWTAYAGSYVLAPCVCLGAEALGQAAVTVAVFALPALSCLLLATCRALPRDDSAREPGVSWRFPWRPVILMASFTFATYLALHFGGDLQTGSQLGQLAISAVVLAVMLLAFDRFDTSALYKVCPALLVAGLLLCTVQGVADPLGMRGLLVSMGYEGFTLYTFLALSAICYRFGAPSEWLFGITRAVCLVTVVPGSLLGDYLNGRAATAAGSADAWATIALVIGGVIVALVLLAMLLMASRASADTWGIRSVRRAGADGQQTDDDAARATTPAYLEDRTYRCALLARHYGLTHREEEVLSLLSQGNSLQQVEETLCIAHGTLRVHVQHVYAKLGVHSYEEARAFVDDWRP
ncbi:MAG: helix-turn-helix transcriptional regulator [Coriobacteriales bacterium]|jgi:DNA-binding CsgD family transcriptional regulator